MLKCKQATQLLSQALEQRLDWRDQIQLRLHVMICTACRRTGAQFKFLRVSGRRYREHLVDVNPPAE